MKTTLGHSGTLALLTAAGLALSGCGRSDSGHEHGPGAHTHADGTTHDDHDSAGGEGGHEEGGDGSHGDGHEHEEVALGSVEIGGLTVGMAQGHGAVAAGKEGHLVVRLPYSDEGETVVRAWIGVADRTLSFVGKGEYSAARDEYGVHATAPDPLPEGAMWWVEIERPDGTRAVGSVTPLFE